MDGRIKEQVYRLVQAVPAGRVITYGQIAEQLGNKGMCRAVGNILHCNPNPAEIPCHRVVNAKGEVSASFAFGGAVAQRCLLEREGILFQENGKIDLKKYGMN